MLALAREPRLRCYSHVDERCAGFFALGLAKATGRPVAVACTSGTAAADCCRPCIEAHEARVPLLVLTADRPPELREVGAGQTIDQIKLYGGAAKWFFEVGDHDARRPSACAGCARSPAAPTGPRSDGRPGPVHLNFPLREPLVPDGAAAGRTDGGARRRRARASTAAAAPTRARRRCDGSSARCVDDRDRAASIVAGR